MATTHTPQLLFLFHCFLFVRVPAVAVCASCSTSFSFAPRCFLFCPVPLSRCVLLLDVSWHEDFNINSTNQPKKERERIT
jgi:hypothetical protein